MTSVAFDTSKFSRRLRDQAGFTPEHAEAAAEALAERIGGVRCSATAGLPAGLRDFERRLTCKIGSMMIVAVGIIVAALRFLPPPHP